jgi:predicted Rossmann fold nucleotide-binding protein DprA/Smf involved in DNA uptake
MRIELAAAAPSMQRVMLQRALDKGKVAAWGRATVAERDMCMHLPQSELLDALGFDPCSLEVLQSRTGWDTARLQAQLMEWELLGKVGRLPGGLLQRLGGNSH